MEKYHLFVSLTEDSVEKLKFSQFDNDLDEIIKRLEKILAIYKTKKHASKT